jgi:SnoaL-like domain
MEPNDTATRLARLEARAEIQDLVTRYFHGVDARAYADVAALFARDGRIETPSGLGATGTTDLATFFETRLSNYELTYHYPHSELVTLAGNGTATGIVDAHAEHGIDGTCVIAAVRYDDAYVVEDGAWRFARRSLSFRYFLPWNDLAGAFHEGAIRGRPTSS